MTKVPFGGAGTGASPTDRGKKGTKKKHFNKPMIEIFIREL